MSVGDKVFICSFMQWLASASLQCLFEVWWATDTRPVCSHTTVMMPEPIHTIIKESMAESIMFVDFLIIRMAKLSNNIVTAQAIALFFGFSAFMQCSRRVNQQVQIYYILLETSHFGVWKLSFCLGLLFIFFCIIAVFLSVNSSKFACFGIYRLMSLFVFSTAPFCHEA